MKWNGLKSFIVRYDGEFIRVYKENVVDKAIAKLKAENESLKASHYSEMVDAGMKERKLKRALYKACANWARFAVAFFSSYTTKEKWQKMANKCIDNAEKYK